MMDTGPGSPDAVSASSGQLRLCVDVVLMTVTGTTLRVLLARRRTPPFEGMWGLPGAFIEADEPLESAAARVVSARTGLNDVYLEQLQTFGAVGRDPRLRVVSVAYIALVDRLRADAARLTEASAFAAIDTAGYDTGEQAAPGSGSGDGRTGNGGTGDGGTGGEGIDLAFDHGEILGTAIRRLRERLDQTSAAFRLLPDHFTLLDLQHVHEAVLGRPLNKPSFRRRMLATPWLAPTGEKQTGVDHRPADLYRFTG